MQLNMWLTIMIMMSTAGNKPVNNNPLPAAVAKDVAYGDDAKQKFDYYLPAKRNARDTKILILIHGGGWIGGDKRDFQQTVDSLRTELPDYAIFNVNYRLATFQGKNLWPSQMNDVNAAVQYIIDHASEYEINNNKIVIAGASAGANLALLQAYSYNKDGRIKAVIDLFGPTDMRDLYNNASDPNFPFLLAMFLGGTPSASGFAFDASSPVNNITVAAPPTLILHGTNDRTVPIRQSELLKKELDKKSIRNSYIVYEGAGHGWYGKNLSDTYDKMVNFI